MISYEPLWNTLKEKGISQYEFLKMGIGNRLLDALKKNRSITMYTLERICKMLDCSADSVVCFKDDEE